MDKQDKTGLLTISQIPSSIRVVATVTAIRWFGWGFGESLIPVYLYSFLRKYAATGAIGSAYELVFLVSLPFVGIAADKVSGRVLIAVGLAVYPVVGLCYFLGGRSSHVLLFVVVAQAVNGAAYALDQVGRDTYIRLRSPRKAVAASSGYLDTIGDFWWVVAALLSIPLLHYIGVPLLLLMIAPSSLVALLALYLSVTHDKLQTRTTIRPGTSLGRPVLSGVLLSWTPRLVGLATFNFFIGAATTISTFVIPIDAYAHGASLVQVVLIGVVLTIPQILGWPLGRYFGKAGARSFPICLIVFAAFLELLALQNGSALTLVAALGIGVILEFFTLGSGQLLTMLCRSDEIGRAGSVMTTVTELGSLVGPIGMGILIDAKGPSAAFSYLSLLAAVAGTSLAFTWRYWKMQKITEQRVH